MNLEQQIKNVKLSISIKQEYLRVLLKDEMRDIIVLDIKALEFYLAHLESI